MMHEPEKMKINENATPTS